MREFDGTTFGMSVEASSPAFRRMKKNAFTGKIKPRGSWVERSTRCVRAADVAAVMGEAVSVRVSTGPSVRFSTVSFRALYSPEMWVEINCARTRRSRPSVPRHARPT